MEKVKRIFQFAYGWPVLILALVFGFGGAALSAYYKNHWWFIIGFGIDLLLVIGFIVTCEEEGEPSPVMQRSAEKAEDSESQSDASDQNAPSSSPDTSNTIESVKSEEAEPKDEQSS